VDGSKVEANANRHKVVWAKSRAKYQERLRQKVKELLEEIEQIQQGISRLGKVLYANVAEKVSA
jgi:hypothetical protein